MDLTHRFRVPASVEEAWTAFNHLDLVAPCFPGATISSSDGDHFEGSIKVKIGPLALVYNGTGRFLERDAEARRLVFQASGNDRRGNGTATAKVTASLVENGSGTDVELTTDLDFTGRPAQFGSEVVSDVSDKLFDQFVSCVSVRFADGLGAPAPSDAVPAGPVAADDELWEEWASEEWTEEPDAGDEQPTVEMAAVGAAAAETVTAGAATADVDPAAVDETPAPEPAAPPPPYRYTPPSDLSQTDAHVVANLVGTFLRRYGPLLGFVALALVVVIQLVNRRRR